MKSFMKSFKRRITNKDSKPANPNNQQAPNSEKPGSQKQTKQSFETGSSGGLNASNDFGPEYYEVEDLLTIDSVPLRDVSQPAKRQIILVKKLRLCSVHFNFLDEDASQNLPKERKRQLLLELIDFISTTKNWFSETTMVELLKMISANLFRQLPPTVRIEHDPDPEEDDATLDPAWVHLQIVYELLLRFIVSTDTDTKLMKTKITGPFVLELLTLFNSEDPRERDYLKTILHRIYGKFMSLRAFIRQAINNVFYRFTYEHQVHNGIPELLEILGSIINGFALPLKAEHKKFLKNVLMPLHKAKPLKIYHQPLAYCVTQFIDKDPRLATIVIGGLLKYWPITNSSKEALFLVELEEVLELTQREEFSQVLIPLFQRLKVTCTSPHFQVAERSLFLWKNEYVATITADFVEQIMPIMIPALVENEKHWNPTVHSLSMNINRMFEEMNLELYNKVMTEENARKAAKANQQNQITSTSNQNGNAANSEHHADATNNASDKSTSGGDTSTSNNTTTVTGIQDSNNLWEQFEKQAQDKANLLGLPASLTTPSIPQQVS